MELKYIVYITINLCNGKFYIGVHKTNPDVFDGYIGNGIYRENQSLLNDTAFRRAVKKYGYKNFKRTTIKIFPNTEKGKKEAYELEKILVNSTLLKSKNVYNVALGGLGNSNRETKKVYQFTLNGEFLNTYASVDDAAQSLHVNNTHSVKKAIRNNCLGKTSSSFGYYWSYTKRFEYYKKSHPVAQYTVKGKFLRYYDSITEAECCLQINTILQAITKKCLAGGYQWKYYNNDSSDIEPLVNAMTKNYTCPIIMYNDSESKKYNNVSECVKENQQLSASQINRVLKKIIKTHKGWKFKYDI